MAQAHNAMLRGINSIYLQAPNVKDPKDIADFLAFVNIWVKWISHHHMFEETRMFPGFEKVAAQPGLLEDNVNQHHAFTDGLAELKNYAETTIPQTYSGQKVQEIIDGFSKALCDHLHQEIDSLLRLRPYDGPGLMKVWSECKKAAALEQSMVSMKQMAPMLMILV
jgi:hemerythrin superfamily protein